MNQTNTKHELQRCVRCAIAGTLALATILTAGGVRAQEAATVIELTQVGCQFLESEKGVDHGYSSKSAEDCEAINEKTTDARLASSKTLRLEPGRYVFRVTNRNVPYDLGFWLRGDGLINRAKLPSVSGGGLGTGTTREYAVDLVPGAYVYSCPLNPTPNYRLEVSE